MEDNDYIVELEIKAREYKRTIERIGEILEVRMTTLEDYEAVIEEIKYMVEEAEKYV